LNPVPEAFSRRNPDLEFICLRRDIAMRIAAEVLNLAHRYQNAIRAIQGIRHSGPGKYTSANRTHHCVVGVIEMQRLDRLSFVDH
jgi:hypothetical protein